MSENRRGLFFWLTLYCQHKRELCTALAEVYTLWMLSGLFLFFVA